MTGWQHQVAMATENRSDHVIVTLVNIRGSAPQVVGSKMIVNKEGLLWGTVGGGKIEAHCLSQAQQMLSDKNVSQLYSWNLQTDIGMTCGGEVSLFFDCNYFSDWTVAIFGAGHISQEMCRVMQTWSCCLKVFDSRPEWLEKLPSSPNLEKKLSITPHHEVKHLPKGTYLLSMTQGHATDLPILTAALELYQNFSLIGVIGSDLKGARVRKDLVKLGVKKQVVDTLICPLGLPFGNNTPPEITISIAAQLLECKSKLGGTND